MSFVSDWNHWRLTGSLPWWASDSTSGEDRDYCITFNNLAESSTLWLQYEEGTLLSIQCSNDTNFSVQMSKRAAERSNEKCLEYFALIGGTYTPDQLAFVDQSSFDCRTTYQGYAWSILGSVASRNAFRVQGRRCVTCCQQFSFSQF